ncbi:ATP-binding protein [Desulfurivibrio alkaliphilus]|uniref:histidine kinase n=1 Tax=Desulfurivibrio alkaliphilus (strain DSM 19089 / UNIQEM U267 / AHT2) TaxID=589865 RepID=D6Z1U5_DESAT|nr:ATP-binding protein [Desulfurivibrio alkaliphilus]ADH85520.1 multi-sensor signal transduction histidine kinase [Desulfurivibrio alkaliphilus AHT 2]
MADTFEKFLGSKHFRLLPLLFLLCLTIISIVANYWNLRNNAHEMAAYYAQGMVRLINDARLWNAEHGGVYVLVSETTPPNPYLEVANRDLVTLDGLELTKINPAYMTRQIAEITKRQKGLVLHLTSSNPVNPVNSPDEWEQKVLGDLLLGDESSRFALLDIPEGEVYRYLSPLYVEPACLRCHAAYGYAEGDLRGGISLTFPASPHLAMISSQINWMLAIHALALLLVSGVVYSLLTRLQGLWRTRQELVEEQDNIIAQRTANLSRQMQRYHTIINTAAEGYWELDAEGRTVMVNEALQNMLGYSHQDMLGRYPHEFARGKNVEIFREQFNRREATTNRAYHVTLNAKDGHEVHARFHATSLLDEHNRLIGSFAFITDITELLEIRQSAAAYALKLERSNKELQDFAHIASHDLQEPLRTIVSFGDRLLLKHADQLDQRGRDYLERIQGAAIRMRQLIEDLLNYSRVTTREQTMIPVDLNEVLTEVLSDLGQRIREHDGRVEVADLPTIKADRGQIHRLFLNLIGNALKFQAQDSLPVVKVSVGKSDAQQLEIMVSDNGIGFDVKYLDRIFRPFQRLHVRGQYQGTGMGLAICKKIVESHQGELTASSKPGEGTTFHIVLPRLV